MPTDATGFSHDPEAERWHHRPSRGVPLNPLFAWPPNPRAIFNWYRGAWLELTALTIPLIITVAVYLWFRPPLEAMKTLQFGWIATIWAINVIPQTLVAGSLHWWLYMRKGQGLATKFEARDLARDNGIFTFNNQVRDNIWWTLGSAMSVATLYQVIIFWAMANGYAPTITFATAPFWFLIWMALIPMWSGLHFYWTHRLEHHPRLYKHVHAVHHRNVNTGPWSGISNHWFENFLYFTTYFIHLILPSHPLHVLFHVYFQQVSPIMSHAGFEKIVTRETEVARSGDFFHQLHHRYFECNYGTSEIPFDKWFGTYHDGTSEATQRTRAHKKQMYTK